MSDVFPRRNLGPAEHWGRTVENRLKGLVTLMTMARQNLAGLGRSAASSAGDMARWIDRVKTLADQIEAAIEATPRYFSKVTSRTGFSFGSGWATVASLEFPRPEDKSICEVFAESYVTGDAGGTPTNRFIWPFNLALVTDEYGPRPIGDGFHDGIDFSVAGGTPIPCSGDGTILFCAYFSDLGNYVRVDHTTIFGGYCWTGYAHMQSLPSWSIGDPISQGQTVGPVGTTGYSTGNHLHFETAPGGVNVNPRDFMDDYGQTSAPSASTEARILINGQASQVVRSAVGGYHAPAFSSSTTATPVKVELQIRTTAGTAAPNPANTAVLAVKGAFV